MTRRVRCPVWARTVAAIVFAATSASGATAHADDALADDLDDDPIDAVVPGGGSDGEVVVGVGVPPVPVVAGGGSDGEVVVGVGVPPVPVVAGGGSDGEVVVGVGVPPVPVVPDPGSDGDVGQGRVADLDQIDHTPDAVLGAVLVGIGGPPVPRDHDVREVSDNADVLPTRLADPAVAIERVHGVIAGAAAAAASALELIEPRC